VQVEVGGVLSRRRPTGHDARRPRPAAHCGVRHGRRSPAMAAKERQAKRDGRGGRLARGRPSDHGYPVRSRVPARRGQAAAALAPDAAQAAGVLEAPAAAGGHDRVADGDVRAGLARLFRRRGAAGLDPGRVRALGRHRPPFGAGAGLRAPLQPQPQRWFWGMRLHVLAAPHGTPRMAILASADQKERDVAMRLFAIGLRGGELVVCDKGYAGRDFERQAFERFGARVLRPARKASGGHAAVDGSSGPLLTSRRSPVRAAHRPLPRNPGDLRVVVGVEQPGVEPVGVTRQAAYSPSFGVP
jgi:hypothetical protein